MPTFVPFRGLRYQLDGADRSDVVAPPYDVISATDRAELVQRSQFNSVRVELPEEDADTGRDKYQVAHDLFEQWQRHGILVRDDQPCFYGYRMTFGGEDGESRSTTGVIGALGCEPMAEGGVLPHEMTTPKARTDRTELLRSTGANLSPIWGLTPQPGLAGLAEATREMSNGPTLTATDPEGTVHECWPIDAVDAMAQISQLVGAAAVVIADGHHRYEVALAHHREASPTSPIAQSTPTMPPSGPAKAHPAETGSGVGTGYVMALVVELAPEQLRVGAIHRLLSALPRGIDLTGVMRNFFELEPIDNLTPDVSRQMEEAGSLVLVTPGKSWLMRPRPGTAQAAAADLDSSRLDVALAALPGVQVGYQHGWDRVMAEVENPSTPYQAGVLLRPATIAQVAATATGGERMPPKTTYFHPKPRTGMVFRSLGPFD